MAKQKDRSEVEALRSENRALKKEVSTLKKALGRHEKREHLYSDLEDRLQNEEIEYKNKQFNDSKRCPKCKDNLKVTDLGSRKLLNCGCGYRKSEK